MLKMLALVGVGIVLTNPVLFTLNAVVYLLTFLVVAGVPVWLYGQKWPSRELFGLQRLLSWSDIGLALLGAIPYIVLALLFTQIATLIPGFDAAQKQDIGFSATNQGSLLLAFVALVIVAPLAEEILFRGYLFATLRTQVGAIASVILTSFTFALLHMQLNVGLDVFALSLVLCTLRIVTGSIWAGVLLHMIKNGLAFYVLFVAPMMLH